MTCFETTRRSLACPILSILFILSISHGRAQPPATMRQHSAGPLPAPKVEIVEKNGFRFIYSNGVPNHTTGEFPNAHNPNVIMAREHAWRVPLQPQAADRPTTLTLMPFGVALNGILFDPGAAEFWRRDPNSGWQYEALSGKIDLGMDANNAHVQPDGSYHYHGLPKGLVAALGDGDRMLLLGYAADGFPIFGPQCLSITDAGATSVKTLHSSYRVKKGERPGGPGGAYDGTFTRDYEWVKGAGELDECNGHVGATPEHPEGNYHYHVTTEYPFIPRLFRGPPDDSFKRRGPPPEGVGGGPMGRRRRPMDGPPRMRRSSIGARGTALWTAALFDRKTWTWPMMRAPLFRDQADSQDPRFHAAFAPMRR